MVEILELGICVLCITYRRLLGVAICVGPNEVTVSDPHLYHELYGNGNFLKSVSKLIIGQSSTAIAIEQDLIKLKIR